MRAPPSVPTRADVLGWLRARGAEREAVWREADRVRRQWMGDEVWLRGIVEFSNVCANDCLYCGLRRSNRLVHRYTMDAGEILEAARAMAARGASTIVLQSGEAPSAEGDRRLADIIRQIRSTTPLAITVSVGNRPRDVYARWRDAGMDRYLLRFETSDADAFARLHPGSTLADRLRCLEHLRELGVQVGSGFMIGLPGETVERLADNLLLCRALDLDMAGIGPFLPHPNTPLAGQPNAWAHDPDMWFLAIAALRRLQPRAHIPATTAFDAALPGGRDRALQCGANVFMPNMTPRRYRRHYLLYPNKPCVDEEPGDCAACVALRLAAMGRRIGIGRGDALREPRTTAASERREAPSR
ncbi:MAG: [FeFe] hydrogenase H-cluster radical SAM maturase HydE [Kiritimatiellae bacterium]|nr:[FeFe] hydrogenase H-cluster radical SAM maturase HydE [Kiritimatiellia bacterium]